MFHANYDYGFRCNAGSVYGFGHLQRCLSLAAHLPEDRKTVFLMEFDNDQVPRTVDDRGYDCLVYDKNHLDDLTPRLANAVMVFDLCRDGDAAAHIPIAAELAEFRNAGCTTAIIDAMPQLASPYRSNWSADVLILPYVGVEGGSSGAALDLVGARYAILSPAFTDAPRRDTAEVRARRVLVTFGGSDPMSGTLKTLRALALSAYTFDITVVIGPAFDPGQVSAINALVTEYASCKVVHAPEDLSQLMVWADLAVSASGLTKYELACTGTPALLLSIDELHHRANLSFSAQATALDAGLVEEISVDCLSRLIDQLASDVAQRQSFSDNGQRLIDGRGSARVVAELENRRYASSN